MQKVITSMTLMLLGVFMASSAWGIRVPTSWKKESTVTQKIQDPPVAYRTILRPSEIANKPYVTSFNNNNHISKKRHNDLKTIRPIASAPARKVRRPEDRKPAWQGQQKIAPWYQKHRKPGNFVQKHRPKPVKRLQKPVNKPPVANVPNQVRVQKTEESAFQETDWVPIMPKYQVPDQKQQPNFDLDSLYQNFRTGKAKEHLRLPAVDLKKQRYTKLDLNTKPKVNYNLDATPTFNFNPAATTPLYQDAGALFAATTPLKPLYEATQFESTPFYRENHFRDSYQDPRIKNYRDDKTHESDSQPNLNQEQIEEKHEQQSNEELSDEEENQAFDVPTKPVYKGEGQWAQRGKIERPSFSSHDYLKQQQQQQQDDEESKPDGHEVFDKNKQLFTRAKSKYRENHGELLPQNHKADASDEESEEQAAEFTPMRLYTQVRRSENEEYLPSHLAEDERLREVVKDSKIQTVYTEEGYEDSAYDHAGHEKNAEEDEGYAEFDKEIEKEKAKPSSDSDAAGSEYEEKKPSKKMKTNNFIKTKETKTTALKDKGDGKKQMEISSEIKIVATPNDGNKTQKYVKIYPKVFKTFDSKPDYHELDKSGENDSSTDSTREEIDEDYIEYDEEKQSEPAKVDENKYLEVTDLLKLEPSDDWHEAQQDIPDLLKNNLDDSLPDVIEELALDVTTDLAPVVTTSSPPDVTTNSTPAAADNLTPAEDFDVATTTISAPSTTPETQSESSQNWHEAKPLEDASTTPTAAFIPPELHSPVSAALIQPEESVINSISESFQKINRHRRGKRDAIPEIEVDTDFIDEIKHPDLSQKAAKQTKYPYYFDARINRDSPLRYSEDLRNVPIKTDGEMSFYRHADRTECASVEDGVDPIPERVNKQQGDAEDDIEEESGPKGPRLNNLGDKIDCFKAKYFGGDNPLDNPIFEEKTIAPVVPIFKSFRIGGVKVHRVRKVTKPPIESNEVEHQVETTTAAIIAKVNEASTTLPPEVDLNQIKPLIIVERPTPIPVTIITTPKYTIDLTPRHIYDQIDLLRYLPSGSDRRAKTIEATTTSEAPKVEALKKRRRRFRPKQRPLYQVFDVNRYLPRNTYDKPTALPKYSSVISEVHYKNEIKPSEQLNVFADVINNIKNSSNNDQQVASASIPNLGANQYSRLPRFPEGEARFPEDASKYQDNKYLAEDQKYRYQQLLLSKYPENTIRLSRYQYPEDNSEATPQDLYHSTTPKYNYANADMLELLKIRKATYSPYNTIRNDAKISGAELVEEVDEVTEGKVVGLMPPQYRYKTIFKPVQIEEKKTMNNYPVSGMKPPSPKQKALLYSDFRPKKYFRRRAKRDAARLNYSEVVRNRNKPIDVEDEEVIPTVADDADDYVPHRPKNYHYDEKTGRIVYDKKQDEAIEEDEVYIEITEAPLPKPTKKAFQLIDNHEGPSFVDFVKKLKANPNYAEIPDPTTTEKSNETSTTTLAPKSTTPPEFLSILAKVKNSSGYKEIEDEDKKTTEAPLEEDEEEEPKPIQNSRSGVIGSDNYQIFDISEYLPKVKNYTPRTSIDYSKYKTIERPSTRHNLSSRYNSDDEDLEDVKTSRVPILMLNEETTTSTTTTTQKPSTTKRVLRTRTRTRRPVVAAASSSPVAEASTEHLKRVYPRRRPTRIKLSRSKNDPDPVELEAADGTPKSVHRRHHQDYEESNNEDYVEDQNDDKSRTPEENRERTLEEARRGTKERQVRKIVAVTTKAPRLEPRKIAEDVLVFKQYDAMQKTGGNYKHEQEAVKKDVAHEETSRLTDVVPKPFAFYTDAKLPKNVNALMEVNSNVDEVEEAKIEEPKSEDYHDDYEEQEDEEEQKEAEDRNDNYEEVAIEQKTTKKPIFIKDPGKRLYYYAPV